MPLRLDLYPPDRAAVRLILDDDTETVLGRDIDSGVRIDHPSVSRSHARLQGVGGSWTLNDLGSKNGSFVDGARTKDRQRLEESAHLRFGDVHADARVIDQDEVTQLRLQAARRRKTVAEHSIALHHIPADSLIQRALDSMVELVEADRGFVLLPGPGGLRVSAHRGVDPDDAGNVRFCGSLTQVSRAIALKTPLVLNSVASIPAAARSQSFSGENIASLLVWPLVHSGEVLAAIYVDHVTSPRSIDELDLELLGAFTEQATLCLVAERRRAALEGWSGRAATVGN